jgi:hypothetical protein
MGLYNDNNMCDRRVARLVTCLACLFRKVGRISGVSAHAKTREGWAPNLLLPTTAHTRNSPSPSPLPTKLSSSPLHPLSKHSNLIPHQLSPRLTAPATIHLSALLVSECFGFWSTFIFTPHSLYSLSQSFPERTDNFSPWRGLHLLRDGCARRLLLCTGPSTTATSRFHRVVRAESLPRLTFTSSKRAYPRRVNGQSAT